MGFKEMLESIKQYDPQTRATERLKESVLVWGKRVDALFKDVKKNPEKYKGADYSAVVDAQAIEDTVDSLKAMGLDFDEKTLRDSKGEELKIRIGRNGYATYHATMGAKYVLTATMFFSLKDKTEKAYEVLKYLSNAAKG